MVQCWDILSLGRDGVGLGAGGGGVCVRKWGGGEPIPSLWKLAQKGSVGVPAAGAGRVGSRCPVSFPASSWSVRSWPVRRQKCSDIMSW